MTLEGGKIKDSTFYPGEKGQIYIYIFDIRYQKWKILPHLIFTSISQITTGENVWREVKLLEEGELSAISLLECTSSGEN